MSNKLESFLLEVTQLKKNFRIHKQNISILDGISFTLAPGETLGIGGESGCGKSTLGKTLLNLTPPSSGSVKFEGVELTQLSPRAMQAQRRHMQMVFQNSTESFNPRFNVKEILSEPFIIHGLSDKANLTKKALHLLKLVGLEKEFLTRYVHELSGGQNQRIAIARALALEPKLIICDEPFSALDASIQLEIMQLLTKLQKELGIAYILISHDLSTLRNFTQRLAIMYLGNLIEIGPSNSVYDHPAHPYTEALVSAVPIPDPHLERLRKPVVLQGELPNLLQMPPGCPFQTRCPYTMDICRKVNPSLQEIHPGQFVACHLKSD